MVAAIEAKQKFIEEVIYDGRYVQDFCRNPDQVASRLNFPISDRLCDELRSSDQTVALDEASNRISLELAERTIQSASTGNPEMAGPTVGVGTAISIITVAIGIVAVVTVCSENPLEHNVIDQSAMADKKL